MKVILLRAVIALAFSDLVASPDQGFPWPPPWQNWQARVMDASGNPVQTTGIAVMKDGQIAVALTKGVAVFSPEGKILRQAEVSSGEIIAIARVGDDLLLAAGNSLLVVDGQTLEKKATIPVGGRIYQIASDADGSRVAVARYGKTGVLLKMADQTLQEVPLSATPRGAAWLPDRKGVVFSTDKALEVFDASGVAMQPLLYSDAGPGMNSPKLTVSSDGKWLIAADENGAMNFWPASLSTKAPSVAYSKGGPWFSAFYANSPTKSYAGHPIGELTDTAITVLHPIPYSSSEVTGITGRPDGTVVFSTWRGDVVCWDLTKAPPSNELAKPVTKADASDEEIPFRFGSGLASFSPIVTETEGGMGNRVILRFVRNGKVLVEYAIPGICVNSSPLVAAADSEGRYAVVATGAPPARLLVTMEQLRETPALVRTIDAMAEMQPSVYLVDGNTGGVSPVGETRGIAAYYPSVNGNIAGISLSAGSDWSGIATLDLATQKFLRTGKTDLPTGSTARAFPMAPDRVALTSSDSRGIQWMVHTQKKIPKSEEPALPAKLPFQPNGAWSTTATTSLNYDVWSAAPSPDGKYLAVVTALDTIDLLAWGEPAPIGCFPARETANSARTLSWQDNDTLVCENGVASVTYRISKDLLRPVAFNQSEGFLGVGADGKPRLVQAPQKSELLTEDGYNHIVTRKDRRRVVWLPGISSHRWCEVPGRDLAAYSKEGLWVSDVASGSIVHGFNAPRANAMTASDKKIFTRSGDGSVFEWRLPPK